MKTQNNRTRIDTTLGELIEAASEVAFEQCRNSQEAYELTSLVLIEMLKRRLGPAAHGFEVLDEEDTGKGYLN